MRSGSATTPEPVRSFGRGSSASRPAGGFRWCCVGRKLRRFVAGHGERGTGGGARGRDGGTRRLPAHLAAIAVLPILAAINFEFLHSTGIGVENFDLERTG